MSKDQPIFGKESIIEWVAKNQNEKVIETLVELAKKIESKDISNSIIMLSNRFENYIKDTRNGVLTLDQQEVSLSKLNESILNLINEIPDEYFQLKSDPIPPPPPEVDLVMKYMIISLFGMGLLGMLFSLIFLPILYSKEDYVFNATSLIPAIASLTSLFTAGLFYTLNKNN